MDGNDFSADDFEYFDFVTRWRRIVCRHRGTFCVSSLILFSGDCSSDSLIFSCSGIQTNHYSPVIVSRCTPFFLMVIQLSNRGTKV